MFQAWINGGKKTGEGCAAGDIDLSPSAFEQLEDLDKGRVPVSWVWLDPVPEGV